jgi:hypothetical protein
VGENAELVRDRDADACGAEVERADRGPPLFALFAVAHHAPS